MADVVKPGQSLIGTETVVFVHIPKTAGSTLNAVIDANYEADQIVQVETPVRDNVERLCASVWSVGTAPWACTGLGPIRACISPCYVIRWIVLCLSFIFCEHQRRIPWVHEFVMTA